jgi:hypothetical protein
VAIQRVRDLEIDQDLVFERRSQRVERIGAAAMLGVVLAAALGLLGSGPLGHASARAGDLAVDYRRFARYQTDDTLTFRLEATATNAPHVRLWVDRAYLDGARLETVVPSPVRMEAAPDRLVFVFAVAGPERPLVVRLRLQPERIGPVHGQVGVEGPAAAAAVTFRQFVWP